MKTTAELIKNRPAAEAPRKGHKENTTATNAAEEREARKCYADDLFELPRMFAHNKYRAAYEDASALFMRSLAEDTATWSPELRTAEHAARVFMSEVHAIAFPINTKTSAEPVRIDNLIGREAIEGRAPRIDMCNSWNNITRNYGDYQNAEANAALDEFTDALLRLHEAEAEAKRARAAAALAARREVLIASLMNAGYTAEAAETIANNAPAL